MNVEKSCAPEVSWQVPHVVEAPRYFDLEYRLKNRFLYNPISCFHVKTLCID